MGIKNWVGLYKMSLARKRGDSLKAEVYTPEQVKNWLSAKEDIKAEITPGDAGESFAIMFKPTSSLTRQDLTKVVGHVAALLDKDKPFSRISSIRLVKRGNQTYIRIGWST